MSRVRSDLRQKRLEDEETPSMSEADEIHHRFDIDSKHGRKGQQYAHDEFRGGRRGRGGRGKGSGIGDSSRLGPQHGGGDAPENKRIGRVGVGSAKQHAAQARENLSRQKAGPLWNAAHRLISHIEGKMNEDQQIIQLDREREHMSNYRAGRPTNYDKDDYWGHIDVRGLLSDELRAKLYQPELQGGQYVKVRGARRPFGTSMRDDADAQYRAPRRVRGGEREYGQLDMKDIGEILSLIPYGVDLHNQAYKGPQFEKLRMNSTEDYMNHLFNEREGGKELAEHVFATGLHEEITREMDRMREEGDVVDLDELGAPKATESSTGLVRVGAEHALAREREHETTALDRMRYGGRDPFKPKTEQERALDLVKPRGIAVFDSKGRRSKIRAPHHAPTGVPTLFGELPLATHDIEIDSKKPGTRIVGVRAARPTDINPITGEQYGADPNVVDVNPSRIIDAPDRTKQLGQGE